ncbi:MAG: phytanoyl-CoA hydroxylase [Candidatus Latescibacterota bacterium]|jgi:phytanoyl-CoA hydroxylase
MSKVNAGPVLPEREVEAHTPDLYHSDTQAQLINNLTELSDKDLCFFREQGYLAVKQVFTAEQIAAAQQGVQDLIAGKKPAFRGVQREASTPANTTRPVRKLMSFVAYDERLKAMAEHPELLSLMRRIMDGEPDLFQDMALLKGPGGREKPWHQDCAYFDIAIGTPVIGIWIALDEASEENGCLHILPGTHREGPSEHFKVRDWQICDSAVQTKRSVTVPLPPGGCLIWHGMLHHGSPTNRSDQQRSALQFHYKPLNSDSISTDERMRQFGGAVRGAQC